MEQNGVQGEWTSSGGETVTTSSGQAGGVSRIVMAWRALCDSFTPPLGYEDETGFHYGDRPNDE
jgi:hypothetical protein